MSTKKITELNAANSVASSDLLVTVTSPSGSAATKKITVQNFFGNVSTSVAINNTATVSSSLTVTGIVTTQSNTNNFATINANNLVVNGSIYIPSGSTPANSTSLTITKGSIFYDSGYIYVAIANNTVKRAALSTF